MAKGATTREYRAPVTIAPPTAPVFQGTDYVTQRYPGLVQTNQVVCHFPLPKPFSSRSFFQYFKNNPNSAAGSRVGSYSAVSVSGRVSMQTDPYSGEVSIVGQPMGVAPPPPMQSQMGMQQQQAMSRYSHVSQQQQAAADAYHYGGGDGMKLVFFEAMAQTELYLSDYFAPPPAPEDFYADQSKPFFHICQSI